MPQHTAGKWIEMASAYEDQPHIAGRNRGKLAGNSSWMLRENTKPVYLGNVCRPQTRYGTHTCIKCEGAKYFTLCNHRHLGAPNLDGVCVPQKGGFTRKCTVQATLINKT